MDGSTGTHYRVYDDEVMTFKWVNSSDITIGKGDQMDSCEAKMYCGYEQETLAEAVVSLEATEDQKLMKKYNIVRDNGTLTSRGRDLLLQVLLQDEEIAKKVVEALRKIDEERRKDK